MSDFTKPNHSGPNRSEYTDKDKSKPFAAKRRQTNTGESYAPKRDSEKRNFDKRDFDKRDFSGRDSEKRDSDRPAPVTFSEELIALDLELMKLIVRRSKLLSKAKGKLKGQALLTLEKDLRKAFEANATNFSRDPRFSRQFFSLLQELKIIESKDDLRKPFALSPARRPVDIKIPTPPCRITASISIALGTAKGLDFSIERMPASDHVADLVKALNLAGGRLFWSEAGKLSNRQGSNLSFAEKTLYVGDDLFNFILLLFLSTLNTGRCRFAGGSKMRTTMLRPLRNFLPQLGARMAHQTPGSNSLPVYVESSGVINSEIEITEDIFSSLPDEERLQFALCFASSLFTAMLLSGQQVSVNYGSLPVPLRKAFDNAVTVCMYTFSNCAANMSTEDGKLMFFADQSAFKANFQLIASSYLSGFLLALPLAHGGTTELYGESWPNDAEYHLPIVNFFEAAGLKILIENNKLTSQRVKEPGQLPPLQSLPSVCWELGLAIASIIAMKSNKPTEISLEGLPEGFLHIAEEFFALLGLEFKEGALRQLPRDTVDYHTPTWNSPSPLWTQALCLASTQKPNLSLLNPGDMTALWSSFWTIFNGLPNPDLNAKNKIEQNESEPVRRRLIAE